MKESEYIEELTNENDETDMLRLISDLLKNDMLRYRRVMDAQEEFS